MQPAEMKTLEKKALDRIVKARMALVLRDPFFGSLALRLKLQVAWWIPTCAVNGKHLFYNPAFVEVQDDTQLRGLVRHEVLHCANGHPWRRSGRNPQLSNIAQDYAVNQIILDAEEAEADRLRRKALALGAILPQGALIDPRFRGMAWEQIYAVLRDEAEQERREQQQQQQAQGDSPGASGASEGDAQPDPRAPKYEPTFGEVLDAPEETAAKDEADWRVAVVQAYEAAKAQGKVPAGVDRLVEEFVEPKVDWKSMLRRFVQQTAALDYTWRLPSPRYMASGLYLPRLQSEQMPQIVIGVDTSGSIGQAELAAFTAEISAVIEECKPEVTHVVYCDADIAKDGVQEFMPGDPLVYKPTGGGGTDFRPVFDWVEEQGIEPACLIYLTDTYGTAPHEEPGYPVLWAVSVKNREMSFGETLYIGE